MAIDTPLRIVNAACARIGEAPLQSFSDDVTGGQNAELIYEETVDFNLSLTPFSWAQETRQLSKVSGATPLTGYDFLYDIPGQFLGPPIRLSDDATDPCRRLTAYLLQGRRVHSSADPLFAVVRFRPDPQYWTATFRSATICAIAAKMAIALASDKNMYNLLDAEAYGTPSEGRRGGLMGAAIFEDAFAQPPRTINASDNPLTRARFGS